MKTITKFAAGALLALSVAAPAFAFDPEAQILIERGMANLGQNQAYSAHAQAVGAPTVAVDPESQVLAERDTYQAMNAHAEVRTWAGTRR